MIKKYDKPNYKFFNIYIYNIYIYKMWGFGKKRDTVVIEEPEP